MCNAKWQMALRLPIPPTNTTSYEGTKHYVSCMREYHRQLWDIRQHERDTMGKDWLSPSMAQDGRTPPHFLMEDEMRLTEANWGQQDHICNWDLWYNNCYHFMPGDIAGRAENLL